MFEPISLPLLLTWVDIGLLGLILDVVGATGLAVKETNRLSNWLSRKIIAPILIQRYRGLRRGINSLKDQEELTKEHSSFHQVKRFTNESRQPWMPDDVENENVDKLIVRSGREIDDDDEDYVSPGNRRVVAITPEGDELIVDGFPHISGRLDKQSDALRNWLEDMVVLLPTLILIAGFSLQTLSYIFRNYSL